jgi:hypothetical protein
MYSPYINFKNTSIVDILNTIISKYLDVIETGALLQGHPVHLHILKPFQNDRIIQPKRILSSYFSSLKYCGRQGFPQLTCPGGM